MFNTFRNAWKIADLRKRIFFTILILIIFRLGTSVPVPFINAEYLESTFLAADAGNIFSMANFMSGGALSTGSLFALGVQPYINASIIMQLLAVAFPYLEKLQKGGPDDQKKFQRITRYAGAVLAAGLGFGYYWVLRGGGLKYGADSALWMQVFTAFAIVLSFTAGALLVNWLGEQIDQVGVGNGVSMIIFAGIVSRFPQTGLQLAQYWGFAQAGMTQYYVWVPVILLLTLAAIVMVIILNEAERRIPVQYAKRVVGRKMFGGQSTHIPIKVNMSGVMPVIFASSITAIPSTIMSFFSEQIGDSKFWSTVMEMFSSQGVAYAIIYGLLILGFNYFYVAITYNPKEMADNLRVNGGSVPGVRSGKPTSDHISKTINRVTLIGAFFLLLIAVGPIFLAKASGVQIELIGTSLLIVVGVALDTARSLESFMLTRHHKGFMQ